MKSISTILTEAKKEKEGRDEKFFVGFEDRNGPNIYLEKPGKGVFAPIEKISNDDVEKYGWKDVKNKAEAKMKQLQAKYEDYELEIVSEFTLAKYFN